MEPTNPQLSNPSDVEGPKAVYSSFEGAPDANLSAAHREGRLTEAGRNLTRAENTREEKSVEGAKKYGTPLDMARAIAAGKESPNAMSGGVSSDAWDRGKKGLKPRVRDAKYGKSVSEAKSAAKKAK